MRAARSDRVPTFCKLHQPCQPAHSARTKARMSALQYPARCARQRPISEPRDPLRQFAASHDTAFVNYQANYQRVSAPAAARPCRSTAQGQPISCSKTAPDFHLAPAMLRWAVDTEAWKPSEGQLALLLRLLPSQEAAECRAFRLPPDCKRALISRLLQRACISQVLGIPWQQVQVRRTRGRKPYCGNLPLPTATAPNFNFNVSHEGSYVVIAAEPLCLCGVDVAAPQQLRPGPNQTLQQALSKLQDAFATQEWALLQACGSDDQLLQDTFQQLWSVKEAYVKARGDGLGFSPLSRVHARLPLPAQGGAGSSSMQAQLVVDGVLQDRWTLQLCRLPQQHWVCVALGPPEEAVDAWGDFTGSFRRPQLESSELQAALHAPRPGFDLLTVEDLLPPEHVDAYLAVEE